MKRLLLVLFSAITIVSFAQKNDVSVQKTSDWVTDTVINYKDISDNPAQKTSGFYYLYAENQDHLAKDAYYTRIAAKVLNNEGLSQIADIYVDYDPEYNELFFHHINIIRDGEVIDKLDASAFKTIQREQNFDINLYDGKYTALYHITDLRVGDIVDYAYTIKGSNPIFEGNYHTYFNLEFAFPIHDYFYTIYVPNEEEIEIKKFNDAPNPTIENHATYRTYKWHAHKPQRLEYENNVPVWYDETKAIEVSQYKNWTEVNHLLLPHYKNNTNKKALNDALEKTLQKNTDDSLFIENAIRFVQNDIRYLGFENGLNSYKPSQPLAVLKRRFGDCKDKSFLLAEILNANGYKAYPVLVNSLYGKNLEKHLPSPTIFDHCIVQINNEQNTYYIDPTITSQGGSIENTFFPDYKTGLRIAENTTSLIKLPPSKNKPQQITEIYNISNVGGGAYIEINSDYYGNEADIRRQEFANSNPNSIQKEYTEFYSALYPDIEAEIDVKYSDDKLENKFSTNEFLQSKKTLGRQ